MMITIDKTRERLKKIETSLEKHFKDDDEALGRIEEKMGFITKDLSLIRENHEKHFLESSSFRANTLKVLDEIKQHTAPVIKEYEDKEIVDSILGKKKEKIKEWANLVTAFGVIGGMVVYLLSKFL